MDREEKAREARLRYLAKLNGWVLRRSRARSPYSPLYDKYQLADLDGTPLWGDFKNGTGITIEKVEQILHAVGVPQALVEGE